MVEGRSPGAQGVGRAREPGLRVGAAVPVHLVGQGGGDGAQLLGRVGGEQDQLGAGGRGRGRGGPELLYDDVGVRSACAERAEPGGAQPAAVRRRPLLQLARHAQPGRGEVEVRVGRVGMQRGDDLPVPHL